VLSLCFFHQTAHEVGSPTVAASDPHQVDLAQLYPLVLFADLQPSDILTVNIDHPNLGEIQGSPQALQCGLFIPGIKLTKKRPHVRNVKSLSKGAILPCRRPKDRRWVTMYIFAKGSPTGCVRS
jgi:hypothetical protein